MKGLLLRDYFIIRKKFLNRLVVVCLTIGIVASVVLGPDVSGLLGICFPFFAGALIVNIFSEDEKDNWDRTAKLLPVSTGDIVRARYIVFGITILASCCAVLPLIALSGMLHSEQYTPWLFVLPAAGLVVATLYVSCVMPFCYKYGAQGSAVVCVFMTIFISALGLLIRQDNVFAVIEPFFTLPLSAHITISVAIVLFSIAISYIASVKIYDNKIVK